MAELEARAAQPDFWNDQIKAKQVIDQTNALRAVLSPCAHIEKGLEEVGLLLELAEETDDDAERLATAQEIEGELERIESDYKTLEFQSLLGDPLDSHNAYLSLHAGAGGTESCDWADMLLRMYTRYAETHGFEVDVLDLQPGDEAGVKSVSLLVRGPYAYGYLKAERGVHRLVRISPFDSNSRRHTSFVALDVVAEIDEDIEINIDEKDLKIDTYRASGAGGQHVNTTDSAVRITHQPTGIVVQCQAERSQHSNRQKAMKLLQAKLYDWELDKKRKQAEKFYGDKGDIAWGRQIRSYVMQPYTMVKDHRTDTEMGQVERVLDGGLGPFIESYLKKKQAL